MVIVELSRLGTILPPALVRAYESGDFSQWLTNHENACRVRPIPTRTATGEGVLFAMVPERLEVLNKGERYPVDYLVAAAPLGASLQGFDAVLPPT